MKHLSSLFSLVDLEHNIIEGNPLIKWSQTDLILDSPLLVKNVELIDVLRSDAHIFAELIELRPKQSQMGVDVLRVGNHIVDLIGEAHVLRLLRDQIVLADYLQRYIFYSNIFTSISNFIFES